MDLIDTAAGSTPPNLDEMFAQTEVPRFIPEPTANNRAGMTALLSNDPMSVEETYSLMLNEAQEGRTETMDRILSQQKEAHRETDLRVITDILADPEINIELKRKAIGALNSYDSSENLHRKYFAMEEPGADPEHEAIRTVSSEELFGPIHEARVINQGLLNAHAASLNSDTVPALVDFLNIVAPFAINELGHDTLSPIIDQLKIEGVTSPTLLPGSAVLAIRDALTKIPPERQGDVAQALLTLIKDNAGSTVINNDNDFAEFITAQMLLSEGGYSSTEAFIDNVTGLLDIVGIGSALRLLTKSPANYARTVKRVTPRPWKGPFNTPKDSIKNNNASFRGMHYSIEQSPDDRLALGFTGMTRDEAIIDNVMPQAPSVIDRNMSIVPYRTPEPTWGREPELDPEIMKAAYDDGGIHLFTTEKRKALYNFIHNTAGARGLWSRDNMMRPGYIDQDGTRITAKMVYGADSEKGWLRAEDASAQARFALQDYGISEKDIKILQRRGDNYEEVNLKDVEGIDGDYLVEVNFNHEMTFRDFGDEFEQISTKRYWFDRVPAFVSKSYGSLTRYLLDAASVIDPRITAAADVAADKAPRIDKILLRYHKDFSDRIAKMEGARRDKLMMHIKEANEHGLELSDLSLKARGFEDSEIETLKVWRKAWDQHYWLENMDLVKTLKNSGHEIFESNGDRFIVKKAPKDYSNSTAYDPSTGSIVTIGRAEIDRIYDQGGNISKIRRSVTIGGQNVENIIIRNTPKEFSRQLTDLDRVLEYRKGYYQVNYKSPKFIYQNVYDAAGKKVLYTKAIAVANDTPSAQAFLARKARQAGMTPEKFGGVRNDIRSERSDVDTYWDLRSVEGRIAQRHRGKQLEGSNSSIHVGEVYMEDPIESAIRAARSISGRVAARHFLETTKRRIMQQFADVMPANKQWPTNPDQIGRPGEMMVDRVGQARANWEYINYLENGYINSMDEGYKGLMNLIGDTFGLAGFGKTERAARALGKMSPTHKLRALAFNAYIALGPIRQALVQSHQALRLFGYHPQYAAKAIGRTGTYISDLVKYYSGQTVSPEGMRFMNFIDEAGMIDSIDRHNLVKGTLSDFADSSSQAKRVVGKVERTVLGLPRRAGFDVGETFNLLSALTVEYERALDLGIDITKKAARDEAYARARAVTGSMNYAGDMPINHTAGSMVFQFLQIPHKMALQWFTNRRLSPDERMRLFIADSLAFGIPGAALLETMYPGVFNSMSQEVREKVRSGFEAVMVNKMVEWISGKNPELDLSSLSAASIEGWKEILVTLSTDGPLQAIMNAPGMSLFAGKNPRITNAFKKLGRYFGATPHEDLAPDEFSDVAIEFLRISSGFNAAWKANKIRELGKIVNEKNGHVVEAEATFVHMAAQAAGIPIETLHNNWSTYQKAQNDITKQAEEGKEMAKLAFKVMLEKIDGDPNLVDVSTKAVGIGLDLYRNNPVALEAYRKELKNLLRDDNTGLMNKILKHAQIPVGETGASTEAIMSDYLKNESEDVKRQGMEILRMLQNYKEDE